MRPQFNDELFVVFIIGRTKTRFWAYNSLVGVPSTHAQNDDEKHLNSNNMLRYGLERPVIIRVTGS